MPTSKSVLGCSDCATRPACMLNRVSPAEQEWLQPIIVRRRFRHGDRILNEGEHSTYVRLVKIGNVFGYRKGLDGQERPIGIAGRGAVFGAFGYFGQTNQVSGVAASAVRMCEIPNEALRTLTRENPELAEAIAGAAVRNCGRIAAWSEGMRVRGVVNQLSYALVLLSRAERSDIVELPTHTALAELLGTTRETVARAFSTLKSEGSIRVLERRKCEVDEESLLARLGGREVAAATAEAEAEA